MSLRNLLAPILLLATAGPAAAAPMTANATLSVHIQGLAPVVISSAGTLDVTGGVVSVPAGLVTQPGVLVVPVTATSAVHSLSVSGLSNLSGVFSVGGMTAQAPGEICGGGGPGFGEACNVGGGLGGLMGLAGVIDVIVVPNLVVIPVDLGQSLIGQGGGANTPYTFDAAGWSTGPGLVNTGVGTVSASGYTGTGGAFQLVTPLFASACGNLLPIFASFTITGLAVPEPALFATLWLGLLAIVVWTRKR